MTSHIDHLRIAYSDYRNGWYVTNETADDNQIGDAYYVFHKSVAIRQARAEAGGIYPIHIHGKNGKLQRTINSANL